MHRRVVKTSANSKKCSYSFNHCLEFILRIGSGTREALRPLTSVHFQVSAAMPLVAVAVVSIKCNGYPSGKEPDIYRSGQGSAVPVCPRSAVPCLLLAFTIKKACSAGLRCQICFETAPDSAPPRKAVHNMPHPPGSANIPSLHGVLLHNLYFYISDTVTLIPKIGFARHFLAVSSSFFKLFQTRA